MYVFSMFRFLVGKRKYFPNFTDEKSMFNFNVVLYTLSDSTFATILITKA